MRCKNCGAECKEDALFCTYCGNELNANKNKIIDEIKDENNKEKIVEKVDSEKVRSEEETKRLEDELIDAYMGRKADKLKTSGFSVCTFFFRGIYFMYRKMYLYGFLWIVLLPIAMLILSGIGLLLPLIAAIVFAINFSKIYTGFVKNEVNKIKKSYPNKTHKELLEICSKRGGTNVVPVVIYVILNLIVVGFFALLIYSISSAGLLEKLSVLLNDKYGYAEDTVETMDNVSYTVPEGFKKLSEDKVSKEYVYNNSDNSEYCTVVVKVTNLRKETPIEQWRNGVYVDKNEEVLEDDITINGTTWTKLTIEPSRNPKYFYVTTLHEKYYEYTYTIYREGNVCNTSNDKVLNSLRIEE